MNQNSMKVTRIAFYKMVHLFSLEYQISKIKEELKKRKIKKNRMHVLILYIFVMKY